MPDPKRELGELGPYVLLEQIAVGGMAEIYLAKTRGVAGFEKLLCLKVIHPNFADDEHFIEMLIDEAKIAVGLNHVNIVQIFDLGRDQRTYFIAMEYIDGADLFKIMRHLSEKDIDVPIDVAAYVAQEICTGLDYAHRKRDEGGRPLGIIHRDISPQNILISAAGEVKIVDFGIAKAASRSRKTQAGVIKGKYYYMSPEQAWGDPVDQRTDIFSTGIILYEVLTGQMLYLEEDMHRLLDMVRKADIPRPSSRRAGIPPQLETIVMKALAKRPADRWQTAHEFQTALTNFLFSFAPAFTPARVARLLENVATEEQVRPRPSTRQVQVDDLMSRVDFDPPREHSVLFRISDLMRPDVITDESLMPGGVSTPVPVLDPTLDEEEDGGERTVISGPPTMMEPRAGFREALPIQQHREAEPTRRAHNDEEGPTAINLTNPMLRSQEAPSPRPRRVSRAIPVEIVVPRTLAPDPPPRIMSPPSLEQLSPTPVVAFELPGSEDYATTDTESPTVTERPHLAELEPAPRLRLSPLPPPPPPVPGVITSAPDPRVPALPPVPLPPSRPAPPPEQSWPPVGAPLYSPGGVPAMQWPPSPVPPMPNQPWSPDLPPAPVAAQLPLPAPASLPPSGPVVPSWPPLPPPPPTGRPAPAEQGWPSATATPNLSAFSPAVGTNTEKLMNLPRGQQTRWRTGLIIAAFVAVVLGGASALVLFLLPTAEEGGKINVISVPEGASVSFDGKPVGKVAPVTIAVSDISRPHIIEVHLQNYKTFTRSLSFSQGETSLQVLAVLTPIFGRLEVRSTPDKADVYIDNTHRGRTPLVVENLTPTNDVTIELRRRGYRPVSQVLSWEGRTFMVFEATLKR